MNPHQKNAEIEIAWRLAVTREQRRGLASMGRPVIRHVDETMPEDAGARLALANGIGDALLQVLFAQAGEIRPHRSLVLAPLRFERFDGGEVRLGKVFDQMRLALKADAPRLLRAEDVRQRAAQAAKGKLRGRNKLLGGHFFRRREDLSICPVVVVEEEGEGGEVHAGMLSRRSIKFRYANPVSAPTPHPNDRPDIAQPTAVFRD